MVVTDVYNSRFHRMYSDKDSLNLILDRDDIYVYELPPEQNDIFSVCVYFREETYIFVPVSITRQKQT